MALGVASGYTTRYDSPRWPQGAGCHPKTFREAVNLEPGDEVTFSRDGNAIRVERLASPDALMGRLAGHRLVKALEEDRRAERRR